MQIFNNGIVSAQTQASLHHLEPQNGVSYSHMNTTVAALKAEFQKQKKRGYNSHKEAYVFGQYLQWLVDRAKKQKPIQDKKNYVEKIDLDSAQRRVSCVAILHSSPSSQIYFMYL